VQLIREGIGGSIRCDVGGAIADATDSRIEDRPWHKYQRRQQD
jgi:hypothetical protein